MKASSLSVSILALLCSLSGATQGLAAPKTVCRLPPPQDGAVSPDDVKYLIGWVFDVAASHRPPAAGDIVDSRSGLASVPGFAAPTSLAKLAGRYRVIRPPFDGGRGYFGMELGALDRKGQVTQILLINRLFRLPVVLHEPIGVLTDLTTNAAMFFGWKNRALSDAQTAASMAADDAARRHIPLVLAGQSQAGGIAQLQTAFLALKRPEIPASFVTLNAAYADTAIKTLGLDPARISGVNFAKDLDPGFGPHGILPNHVGLQIYLHADGTSGLAPGDQSLFAALRHPGQHLLSSFNDDALALSLKAASICAG
jgi:hypothetical protein